MKVTNVEMEEFKEGEGLPYNDFIEYIALDASKTDGRFKIQLNDRWYYLHWGDFVIKVTHRTYLAVPFYSVFIIRNTIDFTAEPNMSEDEWLLMSQNMDEHDKNFYHPCNCKLCMSYN